MSAREARGWLGVLGLVYLIVAIVALGCTRIVAVPPATPAPAAPPASSPRRTVLLSKPMPGDTLAPPGLVKVLEGCSVYAWRLARDSTLRLTLSNCHDVPPPVVGPSSGGAS